MTTEHGALVTRKRRHIDVCLSEPVEYQHVSTGLERYRLPYDALTQTNLADIDISTEFLGERLQAPVLLGAMTGGAELSETINRNLAVAAQKLGLGMMLGSQRIMLDPIRGAQARSSFAVRDVAPEVLLIGNIGLSQLNEDTTPQMAAALDAIGANALAVHTNPLQEAMQANGDHNFSGSLARLRAASDAIRYPLLLKEVGHGLGAVAVAQLMDDRGHVPVAAIDIAGAGGTSWARVEQFVRHGELRYPDLADWGIPTAAAIGEARELLPRIPLVASGGIRTGMDAAKALALGADVVAVARPLLSPALESAGAVLGWLQRFIDEFYVCCHGVGAVDIAALKQLRLAPLP